MKFFTSLAVILFLGILSVQSQKAIQQGVITQKQIMTSSNEELNVQLASLGEMISTTYFKNLKSRTESSNPMSGNTVSIISVDDNEMFVYFDNPMLGKKYGSQALEMTDEDKTKIKVTPTEETKTILGYLCKRYNVDATNEEGTTKIVFYTTDKISTPSAQNARFLGDVSGYPLLTEISANQMGNDIKISIEVTSVEEKEVADDLFKMSAPEGYEKLENLSGL